MTDSNTPASRDDAERLQPCPFCGSANIDPHEWLAIDGRQGPGCSDCGATADSSSAWNTRASDASLAAANARVDESQHNEAYWWAEYRNTQMELDAVRAELDERTNDYDKTAIELDAARAEIAALRAVVDAVYKWRNDATGSKDDKHCSCGHLLYYRHGRVLKDQGTVWYWHCATHHTNHRNDETCPACTLAQPAAGWMQRVTDVFDAGKWRLGSQNDVDAIHAIVHAARQAGVREGLEQAAQWHDEREKVSLNAYNELRAQDEHRAAGYAYSSYIEHQKSASYLRTLARDPKEKRDE